jgi:hypothetical protein
MSIWGIMAIFKVIVPSPNQKDSHQLSFEISEGYFLFMQMSE